MNYAIFGSFMRCVVLRDLFTAHMKGFDTMKVYLAAFLATAEWISLITLVLFPNTWHLILTILLSTVLATTAILDCTRKV